MPRAQTRPEIILALSPTATARALGIRAERVEAAVLAGQLTVRMIGGKRRISVRDIEAWFQTFPVATRKVSR
jgi:hypothetical protein